MLASVSNLLKVSEEGDISDLSDDRFAYPSQGVTTGILNERDINRHDYLERDIACEVKKTNQTSHSHSPDMRDKKRRA